MNDSLKYWIWLSSVYGMAPMKCMQLIDKFGSPKNIWGLSENELKASGVSPEAMGRILAKDREKDLELLMEKIYQLNLGVIPIDHLEYPPLLKAIHDPPILLYVKGRLEKGERALAIVGSRKSSEYGRKMAETIARELSGCGITVISGMARGIDSHAHLGALLGGGKTVAVLGCGLDRAYPDENKGLMDRIAQNGAVVSEYAPGTPPMPHHFPARNRIISGLSLGTIVIEASQKSGSLITADFALEQGRDVFAVPGNVNSPTSTGTNKLIRDGAKMVTCMEDILEELQIFLPSGGGGFLPDALERRLVLRGLTREEKTLMAVLFPKPLHINELVTNSGMEIQDVSGLLLMLELKGMIEQLPGKIFKLRE